MVWPMLSDVICAHDARFKRWVELDKAMLTFICHAIATAFVMYIYAMICTKNLHHSSNKQITFTTTEIRSGEVSCFGTSARKLENCVI